MKRRFYLILMVAMLTGSGYAIALTGLWIRPSYALDGVYLANATQNLPAQVSQRIKQKIAALSQVKVEQIQILTAEPRTWPDGCLGIQLPDLVCTQALVPGWFITAQSGKQRLNYRTDQTGNSVYLDPSSRP